MDNNIFVLKVIVCAIGMVACGACVLAIIGNAISGYGMNWRYLFAFGAMFYLFSREYDKLMGED